MTKYVAPLHISEATARKYLALALKQDVREPQEMATAYGWLTSVLQGLLDSLAAEKAAPKTKLSVDPLLREFVGEVADQIRKEGMATAADRIVELTGHTLRIADEYLGVTDVKQVA